MARSKCGRSARRCARLFASLLLTGVLLDGSVPLGPSATSTAAAQTPAPAESAALRTQFLIAGSNSIRILIKHAGWYRVTWQELKRAGGSWETSNPLELFDHGEQVPITTSDIPAGDAFEFYGAALDTPSTNVRTYWLTDGIGSPLRIPADTSPPHPGTTITDFTAESIHAEHQNYYPLALASRLDDFFGPLLAGAPVVQDLSVRNLPASPGAMTHLLVGLQGVAAGPHRVTVAVNGDLVGSMRFAGVVATRHTFSVPANSLHDGANSVRLTPSATHSDESLLSALRLAYARTLIATDNRLAFTAIAGQTVSLGGFGRQPIRVFDVTDPSAVRQLLPAVQVKGNGNQVHLRIPPASPSVRRLFAVGGSTASAPFRVLSNQPSTWHDPNNGADLLVIGYKPFLSAVTPLVQLRRSQGLTVAVVDVHDIYDEFGYGDHGPQPIRDFLQNAAMTWSRPPRYVLLVGDASFDPKGYLKEGRDDFVPTQLIDVAGLRVPSDQWLVDFNNNGIPSLAVGRLAVRSLAEARTVVAKILAYSPSKEAPSAVLIAGDNHPDDTVNFSTANSVLASALPSTVTPELIDEPTLGTAAPAAVQAAIDGGPLLVNFLGHGNVDYWAHLLDAATARSLHNGSRLPIFVMMTCLSGMFADPGVSSLSQDLLVAPNGGAVAVWSSTGETGAEGEVALNESLFHQLAFGSSTRLGDAIVAASTPAIDPDVRRTWELFGDPTMPVP